MKCSILDVHLISFLKAGAFILFLVVFYTFACGKPNPIMEYHQVNDELYFQAGIVYMKVCGTLTHKRCDSD